MAIALVSKVAGADDLCCLGSGVGMLLASLSVRASGQCWVAATRSMGW